MGRGLLLPNKVCKHELEANRNFLIKTGFMSMMSSIRTNNDLGHPLCHNLREGNWLMDYTAQRLMRFDATKKVGVIKLCFYKIFCTYPYYTFMIA